MDWYFDNGGNESGPHSVAEINQRIKEGLIIADTLVWQKGMADWRAISDIPEFADWFLRPPPVGEGLRQKSRAGHVGGEKPAELAQTDAALSAGTFRSKISSTQEFAQKSVSMRSRQRGRERDRRQKGKRWTMWFGLAVFVSIAGIAAAAFIFGFDWPFRSQQPITVENTSQTTADDALVTALLASRYGDPLRVVREKKPTEFLDVIAQLDERQGKDRSEASVTTLAGDVTDFFLNRYRPFVSHAGDEILKSVIETRLANLEAVLKIYPDKCAAFVTGGPASLGVERAEVLAPLLYAETTALLSAFLDGNSATARRNAPTDEDLDIILDDWQATGVTSVDIDSLEAANASDPNLCPAMASFLRFVLVVEGVGAERVRASFVSQMAAG